MTFGVSTAHAHPWMTRTVRIEQKVDEMEGVATYTLKTLGQSPPYEYQFLPGQFNMLYLPGVGESAISMSGDPSLRDSWVHTVRVAGNVTATLARLRMGDTLGLRGPFGAGWPVDELVGGDTIVVAGGLGMAPLRPLIYHFVNNRELFGRIWLICGARDPSGLLYPNEYDDWKRHHIEVDLTVDRASTDWTGNTGVVTLLLERLKLPRPEQTRLVTCGPEVMMKYAAATGIRMGLRPEQIWASLERNMQCAVGLCGHCQLGPEFVCKQGPVLRHDRIQHLLSVEQL